jgi:hypothetical protein
MNLLRQNFTRQSPKKEKCSIKVKKNASGKTIEFSGSCSKDEISIAKDNLKEEIDF